MTDEAIISLFTFGTAVVTAVMTVFNYIVSKNNAKTIEILEKNTNSIKDALIASTAKASKAEGKAEGIAQQKAESI